MQPPPVRGRQTRPRLAVAASCRVAVVPPEAARQTPWAPCGSAQQLLAKDCRALAQRAAAHGCRVTLQPGVAASRALLAQHGMLHEVVRVQLLAQTAAWPTQLSRAQRLVNWPQCASVAGALPSQLPTAAEAAPEPSHHV